MSERRRIVIKRRIDVQNDNKISFDNKDMANEMMTFYEQQASQQTVNQLVEKCERRFKEVMDKIASIRKLDSTIQKVFHRQDFVELRIVKKKLDELNSMRSEIVSETGPLEDLLNDAIAQLEEDMARTEEELFERLVELESLRDEEAQEHQIDRAELERAEEDVNKVRENIAAIRQRINKLQNMLEEIKSLPQKINELTTSKEVAEPLFQDLIARFKSEDRVLPYIERIIQDEVVPREYAIIWLWKKVFKPKVST